MVLADGDYFSEENPRTAESQGLEAIIVDGGCKRRLGKSGGRRVAAADFKRH
jgi:hypothetical protein